MALPINGGDEVEQGKVLANIDPRDFEVTVRAIQINAGAGFLVVLTGDILRMPGLPRRPLAESIDLDGETIVGLS